MPHIPKRNLIRVTHSTTLSVGNRLKKNEFYFETGVMMIPGMGISNHGTAEPFQLAHIPLPRGVLTFHFSRGVRGPNMGTCRRSVQNLGAR